MSGILIAEATEDDLPAVGRIENECFSDPWSESTFKGLLRDERATFLVARDEEGVVLGYTAAAGILEDGEILNVAVTARARGKGIGHSLLDAALERLRAQQIGNVYLEVRASNRGAQRLYESRGFAQIAVRRGYYRHPLEDALVLRLDLAAK